MPELSTITDPYLPEPKGASAAPVGAVYIADGAGSGSWSNTSTITDPNLPEPKGVSTAGAGQVYLSNGAGGGSWVDWPSGFGYYQDGTAAIRTFNTTPAKLSINGTGPLSSSSQLPREIRGSSELWDVVNNKVLPISQGDLYSLRIDIPVTTKTSGPVGLIIDFDIGGSASPTAVILSKFESLSRSAPHTISSNVLISALTATTLANGVQIFLSTDTGSITVVNPSIHVARIHSGDF